MITIRSLQIGRVREEGEPDARDVTRRFWRTGFYKLPVVGPVRVTPLGLEGDEVADRVHHGGPDKAMLCYAAAHYADWATEFPDLNLSGGALGENLTLSGCDESNVCLGDRFRVGQCELEVSQPRQPCWKIARRWGVKMLTKRVAQTGRTGWYVRVITPGHLQPGQTFELFDRPHPGWTVGRANDVMFGRDDDPKAAGELKNLAALAEAWKRDVK